MQPVAVTGLGCISSLGRDVAEYWTALAAGSSGIGPLTIVPTERTSWLNAICGRVV